MRSQLEQLGNEQAILMRLAGELSPEDSAELDEMIANDPKLAGERRELREVQERIFSGLANLDRLDPLEASQQRAMRDARRAMNLARLGGGSQADPGRIVAKKRLRYPWWAYPTATAAAVVLAFLVWWGNSAYSPHWFDQQARTEWNQEERPGSREFRHEMDPQLREAYLERRQERLAAWLRESFSSDEVNDATGDHPLARAEEQLARLNEPAWPRFPVLSNQ